MAQTVWNNKAFSLVEMMIAIVIIMISMLALLTAIVTSAHTNAGNEVRNTAIRVTNQTAEALHALAFTDSLISSGTHSRIAGDTAQDEKAIPKKEQYIRGAKQTFEIQWTVADQTIDVKQIEVRIDYAYRNKPAFTTTVAYKHRAK